MRLLLSWQGYVLARVPPACRQLDLSLLVTMFSYYSVLTLHFQNLNFVVLQTHER